MLPKLMAFVEKKFEGVTDNAGVPYMEHLVIVASKVQGDKAKAVALLHDVLEDSDTSVEELKQLNLDEEIIDAVILLTKSPDEKNYFNYIRGLCRNKLAREVKLADLSHNSDLTRLNKITVYEMNRYNKYLSAINFLNRAEKSKGLKLLQRSIEAEYTENKKAYEDLRRKILNHMSSKKVSPKIITAVFSKNEVFMYENRFNEDIEGLVKQLER